jgi:hypothetical protein
MSYVDVATFLTYLRADTDSGDPLIAVAQQAIDAAEEHAGQFIGDDLSELSDSFGALPAPVSSAVMILAQLEFDALDPQREQTLRARAESLLRPYRRSTGFAGSGAEETP